MELAVLGLATTTPAAWVGQTEAADAAALRCCRTDRQRRLLEAIYRQSQVRRRASVLLEEPPPPSPPPPEVNSSSEVNLSREVNPSPPISPHAPISAPSPLPWWQRFFSLPNGRGCHGPSVQDRMQVYAQRATPLALRAARGALERSGTSPQQVRQLILVSCTGFWSPGLDIQLIDALNLAPDVGRTMIGFMGCHGAINGLRVAQAMAQSRPGDRVLLCAVELCSLHFQYGWEPQQIVANALFADGAAALVGQAAQAADASRIAWRVAATGSCVFAGSQDAMTWTVGNHGFRMTLSPRVPELIRVHLADWLTHWLTQQGLSIGEIGSWAIHPGGPRILSAVEAALHLPAGAAEASRQVLAEHGNMSSPTVLFILERLRRVGAPLPCVMLAFGPGLTAEAALLV